MLEAIDGDGVATFSEDEKDVVICGELSFS